MDADIFRATTSALAISLVVTSLFMVAGWGWIVVNKQFQRPRVSAEEILFEAGHRFRQQLYTLDHRHWLYLASLLVFILLLATMVVLTPPKPAIDAPGWVWVLASLLLVLVSFYMPYEIMMLWRRRRNVAYWLDGNMAVGHALQRTTTKGNRVFHNVRSENGVIDNVVVGTHGVYAVNVFVREKKKHDETMVRLKGSQLEFDSVKVTGPVDKFAKQVNQLSRCLSKVIGQPVKVRSVIAVPGWRIGFSGTDRCLLVNEKTAIIITGWTDTEAYLMNEDVELICKYLEKHCSNS
jgi:hypothetical protein